MTAQTERIYGAPPRLEYPHGIKRNPEGWRWRLARYLMGDIEVVPLLPARPIYAHEILVVKLGGEGALNTVEVKQNMHDTTSLMPIENIQDIYPNTFVTLEVKDEAAEAYKVTGHFRGWAVAGRKRDAIIETRIGTVQVRAKDIKAAWYAPMGYGS